MTYWFAAYITSEEQEKIVDEDEISGVHWIMDSEIEEKVSHEDHVKIIRKAIT